MEEDSTPAPSNNDAGGNDADNSANDHSQDDSTNAADKQVDNNQPSTSTDKSGEGEGTNTDDKPAEGDKSKEGSDDKDAPASKFDTDLDEWAESRGYEKPRDDKDRRLLQDIRNGQRDFSRDQQAKKTASKLEQSIQGAKPDDAKNKQGSDEDDEDIDPLEKRTDSLESELKEERNVRLRSEYVSANGVTDEEVDVMGEILKEEADLNGLEAFEFWSSPGQLPKLHTLAKAKLTESQDPSEIEREAARKERERIAKEHQANGSARNASNVTSTDKTAEEKRLERFSNWD